MPFTAASARSAVAARRKKKLLSDEALQDAADAREADRTDTSAPVTPAEERAKLVAQVSDAPEKARARGEDPAPHLALIQQLQKNVENLEKRVIAAESRPVKAGPSPTAKCNKCRQVLVAPGGRGGVCDGNHTWVRVVPKQMDLWAGFQGVTWNGEHYIGACYLPVSIAQDVVASIGRWEAVERAKFVSSGRIIGEFDMSHVGPGSTPLI